MPRIKKKMPIDGLSELPESLLVHILSFLGVKEAVITSVLSKRWKFLWADLPRLEFQETCSKIEDLRRFASRVNRTLGIRRVNYLEEFEVRLKCCTGIVSDIDAWVNFAVKNKVKKLSISVDYPNSYYAPPAILSCSSVMILCVQGVNLPITGTIRWKSLTELYIKESSDLNQSFIDELFENCPVLSVLELDGCWGDHHLIVDSPSLNILTVIDHSYFDPLDNYEPFVLDISAPKMHTLAILMSNLSGKKLLLRNVPSLVKADIDLDSAHRYINSGYGTGYVNEFLGNFQHTQELRVGPMCFKVLISMALNGWQLPQSTRKHLTVLSSIHSYHCKFGIISLLDSSPYLETLVIEGCGPCSPRGVYSSLNPGVKGDDLLHLKTVKVINFAYSKRQLILTLARILLKRATALEEMVIVVDGKDSIAFGKMAKALLAYPRSSKNAVIRFS